MGEHPQKVACITGGARRIGAGIVQYLHARGYCVVIHYRHAYEAALALLEHCDRALPGRAQMVHYDFDGPFDACEGSMQAFADGVVAAFGRLDLLVNNASEFFPTAMGEVRLKDWERLMSSNVRGAFFLSQALYPALSATAGSIVNILDVHATRPYRQYPVYSIAKAAAWMMTESLAVELGPWVRVNGVAPGHVLWPEGSSNQLSAVEKERCIQKTVLKRLATVDDIAAAVYFLSQSPAVTGHVIPVAGGGFLSD
jgi:pteridine reductase